jgi:hypothetical protein
MRMTIIILTFLFSSGLFASTETVMITAIDYPERVTEDVLVFLSSGKVIKVKSGDLKMLDVLHKSQESKQWLIIQTTSTHYIVKVEKHISPELSTPSENKDILLNAESEHYLPSVLKSQDWAKNYFDESRRKEKESQCFNRAHVWSYEWFKKHNFNSSKIFIFFTRKFIREHNFTWWFHVAPYVHVSINRITRERVMDMKYASGPLMIKDWTKRFIKTDNPGCLTVQSFSDYANFPENGNCYIMKTSMYYYWPLDLENEELHGTIKTSWLDEEIKIAYKEAFEITK